MDTLDCGSDTEQILWRHRQSSPLILCACLFVVALLAQKATLGSNQAAHIQSEGRELIELIDNASVDATSSSALIQRVNSHGSRSRRISQNDLIKAVKRASLTPGKLNTFVKMPILLYPLTNQTLEVLLETIKSKLGSVDQATYPEDMLQRCLGGAIVLQVKDGEPDFYPLTETSFKEYKTIPLQEVLEHNFPLYSFLQDYLGCQVVEKELPCIVAAVRTVKVTMVRLSELDINLVDPNIALEVKAPWGGTQAIAANHDAFVAVRRKNSTISSVYIVQEDQQKNPIQYNPAK